MHRKQLGGMKSALGDEEKRWHESRNEICDCNPRKWNQLGAGMIASGPTLADEP